MKEVDDLIARFSEIGEEWWSPGPAREADLRAVEMTLGVKLPEQYRAFLLEYGGGGVPPYFQLCEIKRGKPLAKGLGLVYGQTIYNREEYGLLERYVVIEHSEATPSCWCLDLEGKDAPVTYHALPKGRVLKYAPGFLAYLQKHCNSFLKGIIRSRKQFGL